MSDDKIHRFEEAGLGKAPFRLVGVWSMPSKALLEANPSAWNNAMREAPRTSHGGVGACHYCGMSITDHFIIRSSDNRTFIVGCDCVRKTGDGGLINRVRREANRLKREAKLAKDTVRIEAARKLLAVPTVREALKAFPHPLSFRAAAGDTKLEWAEWMMSHAGVSGKLEVATVVEALAPADLDPDMVDAEVAKREREREEAFAVEFAAAVERELEIRKRNVWLVEALAPMTSGFFRSISWELSNGHDARDLPLKAKRIIAEKLGRAGYNEAEVWDHLTA